MPATFPSQNDMQRLPQALQKWELTGTNFELIWVKEQPTLILLASTEIHGWSGNYVLTGGHPNPVLLPGKSHGRGSLVGCSPWGCEESDITERLHFHVSLSCIGEGNGNPLQYSCLENPRDGGAWWAAVYGVTQSRTRQKQLRSSSSSKLLSLLVLFFHIFTPFSIYQNPS